MTETLTDQVSDSANAPAHGQTEIEVLRQLAQLPVVKRLPGYVRLSGPGWLQGAMTLGGGSAITSLTIGAVYGYELLWVQPIAMIIGCIMLFASSHQTLSTGEKPFKAMAKHVNKPLAGAWAIAALASSIIWGFSHYPLSAGMLEEIIEVSVGYSLKDSSLKEDGGILRDLYLLGLAFAVWCLCAYTAWNYGGGGRAVKLFENSVKILSVMIVLAFAWVVAVATVNGQVDWGQVLAGYIPGELPSDAAGVTTIMAALGTAVGINMTFVYGYTLLQRGWGPEHRELARYDIVLGLVLPYIIVTGLISIAAAAAFYGASADSGIELIKQRLSPTQAGTMFVSAGMGEVTGRLIFAFGVLGMAVGSLVMHMLCCGAAAAELFGWEQGSRRYKLALLAPTPAILGVFVWSTMGPYVVLPTSAICGILLPIAYVGWLILNNKSGYLGRDLPSGKRAFLYNMAMLLCIFTVIASVVYSTLVKLGMI